MTGQHHSRAALALAVALVAPGGAAVRAEELVAGGSGTEPRPEAVSSAAQREPAVGSRLVMTARPPPAARLPPSSRALVDARAGLERRYGELLFRATSAQGADRAAEALVEAGAVEEDRALKWLLFAEARRLGAASGNAPAISRAVRLASATYDFDALEMEYRSLAEIPLRGVSPQRAGLVAEAAEGVAARAEIDGRLELAVAAQGLAIRGWQRAGHREACRRAMIRHDEIASQEIRRDRERPPGSPR